MLRISRALSRTVTAVVGLGLVVAGAVAPAAADTAPSTPGEPATVSADALPTVQVNGVVWQQLVVGTTVYVAGSFTTARPAGAAPGVDEVPRLNLLAYDLTTGELLPGFAPSLNAQALVLAASPDGSRIYVGGDFTEVNGARVWRIAAINATTGTLIPTFVPKPDAKVRAIVATADTVYFGGLFNAVGAEPRTRLAAAQAADGALLDWAPAAAGASGVNAMILSPDGSEIVVGGSFTSLNGSTAPGYGLGAVDPSTGDLLPFAVNSLIRNAGASASINFLAGDEDMVYGSGYTFGGGGNLEGTFAAHWGGGDLGWVEDCHGDTYSVYPMGDVVYQASHKHYCGNIDAYPQTEPWTMRLATAVTKAATGVITREPYSYYNFAGTARPTMVNWFPVMDTGVVTGMDQGPWHVTGNDEYVVMGGEFRNVNGVPQQGLVRFAVSTIAPNDVGPVLTGGKFDLSGTALTGGEIRLRWTANYDWDNADLTYQLIRNSNTASPVFEAVQSSTFYRRPSMGFVDTDRVPGVTYRYRLRAIDPFGNIAWSDTINVTATDTEVAASTYADEVLADGPVAYWRLGEPSGSSLTDAAGWNDVLARTGITQGAEGALGADADTATTFDGTSAGFASTAANQRGPDVFTVETWFRTTTTTGGAIVAYGSASQGTSNVVDRTVYLDNAGRVFFGVRAGGSRRTLNTTTAFNDGQWHHVAASLSPTGMQLYVDGVRIGTRTDTTFGYPHGGHWRIGGDNLSGWGSRPASDYFAGDIDEVVVYHSVLGHGRVLDHYQASGRTADLPPRPADAYGAAVSDDLPELYWRLGEAEGTSATSSGFYGVTGTYRNGVELAQAGALPVADTAARFNGTSSFLSSDTSVANPRVYSTELWFSTTSTSGGKLIGFGNSRKGLSSSYDRHVYLENDGRLTFGVYVNAEFKATSAESYNDGAWHHMVATQSAEGMRLYVDGLLVGTNPQAASQSYTGYWKVGGDRTWGTQPYLDGILDEVAVYGTALTAEQVSEHYVAGGGVVNERPLAQLTATVVDLGVTVDGTASSDPDGTIASYEWAFGDGATATGATSSHTYPLAGTYPVTLTVTDDLGKSATTSQDVTVTDPPPNQVPVALFATTVGHLDLAVDGSGSSDPDGDVVGYTWDFGDGQTASGATATHSYAAAGDYPVTLTVTDDDGAAVSSVQTVTVTAPPPNEPPVAQFTASPGVLGVSVDGTASLDLDGSVISYLWEFGDGASGTGPTAAHTYVAGGDYQVSLTVTDDDGATASTVQTVTVADPPPNELPAAQFTVATDQLSVELDGSSSSDADGTVAAYLWDLGDGQSATGATASHTYEVGGSYQVSLTVTDDDGATTSTVQTVIVTAPPINQAPVPQFIALVTGLEVAVDGSGSSDPDGSVVAYAWDLGDGQTAMGAVVSHAFAEAGTYPVTLTVTDDDGATASSVQQVTVAGPPAPGVLAADGFERTLAGGLGSAQTGGAWSLVGPASRFAVSGGAARITSPTAGSGASAFLTGVSSIETDVSVSVSMDQVANGGGAFFSLVGRRVGTEDYRAKIKVAANGAVTLYLTRLSGGVETTLASGAVAGLTYAAGDVLRVRLQVTGTAPTTVQARVWRAGEAEPVAWQRMATDSTGSLQAAGGVGVVTYLSGSSTSTPLVYTVDDLQATGPAVP